MKGPYKSEKDETSCRDINVECFRRFPFPKYILILLIFLGVSLQSSAESLDNVALKILVGSPEFSLENYSLESLAKNLKTVSNLPDPEVGGEYLFAPVKEDNRWAAELSWDLEWPGVYGARRKEADMKITGAEYALDAKRSQRLAEIKDLLLDYTQCRQKLELLEELSNNNDTIYELAHQAAKGGEMTVLDLNKVKLEYANIRAAKAILIDEKASIEGDLATIYGEDCRQLLENLDCRFPDIVLPSSEDVARIKELAPEVKTAKAEAETVRQSDKVVKMESLPSLSLGYKHQFEEDTHFNGAMLGISIPIFSSRGKRKAVKADLMEAEFKAEATALAIEAEAMAILRRLELTKRQIDEITPIVENADYNTTLLKAYKGGVITLLDYLSERNYFTNATLELVSLRHSASKALYQLKKYLPLPTI